MDPKQKGGQKAGQGLGKQQQRPGSEQVRSSTNIQKSEGENLRVPKEGGQQKQKQERGKPGSK
jgi:hypothetical protein